MTLSDKESVTQEAGPWALSLSSFLARIKELAVVKIHKSRHLVNLYGIVQQSDETVRAFVASAEQDWQ